MIRRGAAALALALAAIHSSAVAQSWRTVTAQRAHAGADSLAVRVSFAGGKVRVAPAPESLLYDLSVRFDANTHRPTWRWDAASHTLTVGADSATGSRIAADLHRIIFGDPQPRHPSELTLGLAPAIPLRLDLRFVGTQGAIDLGGLRTAELHVESNAGATQLAFDTPNAGAMSELRIEARAAELTVRKLGNARAARVQVSTTMADEDLDLGGEWSGTMSLALHLTAGQATLHIPRGTGVRLRASSFLGDVSTTGLRERDGRWVSDDWDNAARQVDIDVDATLGDVDLVWVEP